MKNTYMPRGLSPQFMEDLQNGILNPLLLRARADTSLDMEIRNDYLNVYYRGGNLVCVKRNLGTGYAFTFDTNYALDSSTAALQLPPSSVKSRNDVDAWIQMIPLIKDTMDLWFGKHPKEERAAQQLVVHENNSSPSAGGTDYFIVDIEYDNHHNARFDLVALLWESNATARRLHKGYLPKLTIIEMKSGDGALVGKSGISAHLCQLRRFLGDPEQVKEFKEEMLQLFQQKRDLGLIRSLKGNRNQAIRVHESIDVMFLMTNHDAASRRLAAALNEIEKDCSAATPGFQVGFCTANFMGYSLYEKNILSLCDFKDRFPKHIQG